MRVGRWAGYLIGLLLVVVVLVALEIIVGPLGSDLGSLRFAALAAFVAVIAVAEIHRRLSRR